MKESGPGSERLWGRRLLCLLAALVGLATLGFVLAWRARGIAPPDLVPRACLFALVFGSALALAVRSVRLGNSLGATILAGALLLAAVGLIAQAGLLRMPRPSTAGIGHLIGLAGAILLGVLVAPFTHPRNSSRWGLAGLGALVLSLLLAAWALLVALSGHPSSALRLSLFGLFQPTELIRLLLIAFIAGYMSERGDRLRQFDVVPLGRGWIYLPRKAALGPLLLVIVGSLALLVCVRDLGPLILLLLVAGAMLTAETGHWLYVVGAVVVLCGGGWGATATHLPWFSHIAGRLAMAHSPWEGTQAGTDQVARACWALASGGVTGFGSGRGWAGEKGWVPAADTDLVLAAVGEALGIAGTLSVMAGTAVIVLCGLSAAQRLPDKFSRLAAYGLSCALGLQAVTIIAGTVGRIPLTGITLPLVSRGNASLLSTGMALGLLVAFAGRAGVVSDSRWAWRVDITRWIFLVLLTLVGLRTLGIQTIHADAVALRPWKGPQADGVVRNVYNPRLQRVTEGLVRADILDRQNRPLARTGGTGQREYPLGAAATHVVGWLVSPSLGGSQGAEGQYVQTLTGVRDNRDRLRALRGYGKPHGWKPQPRAVKLALSAPAQERAYQLLETCVPSHRGAAIFLAVQTGEVLVAATAPSFDPARLDSATWASLVKDVNRAPLLNRATNGAYTPGSAFKPVAAAAALEFGVSPVFVCRHELPPVRWQANGEIFERRGIHDLETQAAHGTTDMAEALRLSCNVYFAQLALRLGPEALSTYCHDRCGFTRGTDVEALAQALPDAGYGQGALLVSPLQMARFMSAVANGGKMPEVVWLTGGQAEGRRVMSGAASRRLAQMLTAVGTSGTGAGVFRGLPFGVACKTGTAQLGSGRPPHSWMVGFAPASSPRVAFAVVVENGGSGRSAAGPVACSTLSVLMADLAVRKG